MNSKIIGFNKRA